MACAVRPAVPGTLDLGSAVYAGKLCRSGDKGCDRCTSVSYACARCDTGMCIIVGSSICGCMADAAVFLKCLQLAGHMFCRSMSGAGSNMAALVLAIA